MSLCYLSLGANLGERAENLRSALRKLSTIEGIRLVAVSRFYETAPWGKLNQPPFINAAAVVDSDLSPLKLLGVCQRIEQELGRVRHEHWGARTLDIDLLYMEGVRINSDELTLPHPFMLQRAFVLVPLAEIAADTIIHDKTVHAWKEAVLSQESEASCKLSRELSQPFPLKMIACVDARGGLGKNGQLLAYVPEDLAYFKHLTEKQTVIMGRKTFDSLGCSPLPDRRNIILSETLTNAKDVIVCRDLLGKRGLWRVLGEISAASPQSIFWCIGGEAVYKLLLPYTREIYLTRLAESYDADRFFPQTDDFTPVNRQQGESCLFEIYRRRNRFADNYARA